MVLVSNWWFYLNLNIEEDQLKACISWSRFACSPVLPDVILQHQKQ
jgi:hypothetical protein